MRDGPRCWRLLAVLGCALLGGPGCAVMRAHAPDPDLRPCTDGFAATADGWKLGVRHIRPACPDPGKDPVVLCHGLGLNGTFWTITDDHLPGQLADRGYEVFVVDLRGSGASYREGMVGRINRGLRETPLLELGEGRWTMDDEARYDVPAILDYIRAETGRDRVNWVGHSLGGMLMYAFLELSPEPGRVATFVAMGATAIVAETPARREMLRANRGLRLLLRGMSTGRIARPMMLSRLPGLDRIDRFYYTEENVDVRTISRFYGYALEDPGRGALRQLDPYLEVGRLVSADRKIDYSARLGMIATPTLLVAAEKDIMSDIPSTEQTFAALGGADKTLLRFGKAYGHVADYGHCDLVWSRHAPHEIFPAIVDWLDCRQPGAIAARAGRAPALPDSGPSPARQERVDADLRPGLELPPQVRQAVEADELGVGQP